MIVLGVVMSLAAIAIAGFVTVAMWIGEGFDVDADDGKAIP